MQRPLNHHEITNKSPLNLTFTMTFPFSKVRPNSASTVYVLTERRGGPAGHEANGAHGAHGYHGVNGVNGVRRSWAVPW